MIIFPPILRAIPAIIWGFLGLLLLTFIAYFPALGVPFLWDDHVMLVQNQDLITQSSLPELFSRSAFGSAFQAHLFYRPIQMLSYRLDHMIWGLSPPFLHLTSLIYHSLAATCLWRIFTRLGFGSLLGYQLSALFAVHPLHIQAVAYISGRGDPLFLLFSLLCILTLFKYQDRRIALYCIPLFLLSFLAKENGIIVPVILAVYGALNHRHIRRYFKISVSILLLLSLSIVAWRLWPEHASASYSWIGTASLVERIATVPYLIITYLQRWVFPVPLQLEYHFVASQILNRFLVALAALLALWTWLMTRCQDWRRPFFWSAWFIIGLAPVSHLAMGLSATIREHWLYLPSIGLFGLLGYLVQAAIRRYPRSQPLWHGLMVLLLTALSLRSYHHTQLWQSPAQLYQHSVRLAPKSFLLHNNLGYLAYHDQDFEAAKSHFTASIMASPGHRYDVAHNNLGVLLEAEGKSEQALRHYHWSVQFGQYELAYLNLARYYRQNGDLELALNILEDAQRRHPKHSAIQRQLIQVYLELSRYQKALDLTRQARQIAPKDPALTQLEQTLIQAMARK